jgi:hypothetical protein
MLDDTPSRTRPWSRRMELSNALALGLHSHRQSINMTDFSRIFCKPGRPIGGAADLGSLLARVREAFLATPDLCLSLDDARQLWGLDRDTCQTMLQALTDARFLRRTPAGTFALRSKRNLRSRH